MGTAKPRGNRVKTFQDLEVWQVGRRIRSQLYGVANRLPDCERYNLSAQIRRAAVSLTSNIAEGYGRYHFKENVKCCRISRGSAYELIDHLIACQDERYLKKKGGSLRLTP
ncbi:MAG: four helix bundle protein [Nitrospirota bacterium]